LVVIATNGDVIDKTLEGLNYDYYCDNCSEEMHGYFHFLQVLDVPSIGIKIEVIMAISIVLFIIINREQHKAALSIEK